MFCMLKGHNVVLEKNIQTQDFYVYDINEAIIQTLKYVFPLVNTQAVLR